ncbi:MAG: DUF4442 domain-containing protein [Myxococcota bacterium]
MAGATPLPKLLPSVEAGDRNRVRLIWDRLHCLPGGKRAFSAFVGRTAPYTGSIHPRVEAVGMGHARCSMKDRPSLRNPFRSVHAIALANLAELTGNLAVAYSLPDDARFIVAGLSMEYFKKARGTITAVCECAPIASSERQEYPIRVSLRNEAGEEVAAAEIRTFVGPKTA